MRIIGPAALLVLASCSSSRPVPDPSVGPASTVRVAGTNTTGVSNNALRVTPSHDVAVDTIHAGVEQVWAALPAIYTALSIPLTTADNKSFRFGNEGMKIRRRLGETSLVKLLDCGRTQIGPNAESYDIVLSVMTTLRRHSEHATIVSTAIDASGKAVQFGSETRCRTTGALEKQIALALRARVEK